LNAYSKRISFHGEIKGARAGVAARYRAAPPACFM